MGAIIGFGIGLFVGVIIGVIVASLAIASSRNRDDDRDLKYPPYRKEHDDDADDSGTL